MANLSTANIKPKPETNSLATSSTERMVRTRETMRLLVE